LIGDNTKVFTVNFNWMLFYCRFFLSNLLGLPNKFASAEESFLYKERTRHRNGLTVFERETYHETMNAYILFGYFRFFETRTWS